MMKFKQGLVVLMMCSMFMPIIVVASEQGIQSDASISEDWLSKTLEQIKRDEYNPSMQNADYKGEHFSEPRYHFANREQNLRAYLDENGMELMPRVINEEDSWNLKYHINSIYRTKDDIRIYDNIEPKLSDNKVVYKYQDMTLKYTNSEEGIGQSIIIQERCDGEEKLFIKVEMETQDLLLTQSGNDRVIFSHNGNEIIYRIKKIEDAEKRILSSSIDYDEDARIAIFIDDENAVYPVYVELLISSNSKDAGEWTFTTNNRKGLSETPDWTAESDQADAHFGILVSQAGDVNGDGHSDVIVGAHRYDNGQIDEGRAFVYHGSVSGLSTTPDWTAESNQEDAYFGISVSQAGDVNGDGYSDVIVGASYYDNGQTDEGRAFVYHGSSSGLSTTPDWTVESNQADAYFGNSVSQAGDVN
ncbi:FG-GAP repeat protein, partial [candidate division WOR-3 bacterium]|nr:FG-GAP repeat protein [candidate division WOR-3 bacterium]